MIDGLPTPPTDREKLRYIFPNGSLFSIVGIFCLFVFSYAAYRFCIKHPILIIHAAFCMVFFANTGFCSFGALFAREFDYIRHLRDRDYFVDYLPSVDIFLPSCGEPISILANQFKAVANLDYPDFTVYVLDDCGSESVRQLAELNGFTYLSRPDKGVLKKAGNLRYGFARSSGELIVVFDADFAPRFDFLRESVFYFASDRRLAILQTPQYFELLPEQALIQKGATFLQEVFYRLIQAFRDRWGASVCCGSNAIYRREALEPYGGAAAVERSEDVNTGLSVLRAGWKLKYLPLNLAKGLSPDTIKAFFHQQYRWCCGSMHLVTSRLFWTQPNVSILGKFSYFLSILYYCTSGLGVLMFSMPSIVNAWIFPDDFTIANYSLVFPAVATLILIRGVWANTAWGLFVVLTSQAAAYTHLIGLLDVLIGDVSPWVPTGAAASKSNKYDRFLWVVAFIPVLQFAALLSGISYNRIELSHAVLPIAWLIFQIVCAWSILFINAQEQNHPFFVKTRTVKP